jgi:hypothetical protein
MSGSSSGSKVRFSDQPPRTLSMSALVCCRQLKITSGLAVTRQETRRRAIGEVPSIASCDYGELADLITRTCD